MLNVSRGNDNKTLVIKTQHAQIVSRYLALAAKLIMRRIE